MTARTTPLEQLAGRRFDALVVGGGISGATTTAALTAHGVSTACVDRNDFGSGTSQESSNMVWGGGKYLASGDVGLVLGLCRSRNQLARAFPTRLRETRFLAALGPTAPHRSSVLALGAGIYWGLGRFATSAPRPRTRQSVQRAEPAIAAGDLRGGVEYSDYLLPDNDARFVSEFLFDARDRGATIANYVAVTAAERTSLGWHVEVTDLVSGQRAETRCSALVNTAGPWARELAEAVDSITRARIVFSKGVHLVVPQLTTSGRVLAFFDDDARLFYVLPMGHRSLIGTTDTPVEDGDVSVDDEDRAFLLDQVNTRLSLPSPITAEDVLGERCGVRALVLGEGEQVDGRDWTDLSRRHVVETDVARRTVTVLGGKLTDCLNVGREVVEAVAELGIPTARAGDRWYGEPSAHDAAPFFRAAVELGLDRPCQLEPGTTVAQLLWRRHGRRARQVADLIRVDPARGEPLTERADLCEAEVLVARDRECVVHLDDYLRRRTMVALLDRPSTLARDPGIRRAARVLLGEAGPAQLDGERPGTPVAELGT